VKQNPFVRCAQTLFCRGVAAVLEEEKEKEKQIGNLIKY